MTGYFFCGPLGHAPLLRIVLGREVALVPAALADHVGLGADHGALIGVAPGAGALQGWLVAGLGAEERARLDYFAEVQAGVWREVTVTTETGAEAQARVLVAAEAAAPWDAGDWQARWAETAMAAAEGIMGLYGSVEPARVCARRGQIMTRAGAQVRARESRPETECLRRQTRPDDVDTEELTQPYAAFFSVEERSLRFRRFDGTMSAAINRAVFISGDASVVLPYDPVRDRVLLIEQFRAGPHARGDLNPWLIETIAGRIDGGETPEEAARREAREEAGIALGELIAGPRFYPSPAAKAEYIYTFIGLADLPDEAAGIGGVADEAEDIRSHIVSFDRLMELVQSGEVDTGPLTIIALWLARERPRLRAA